MRKPTETRRDTHLCTNKKTEKKDNYLDDNLLMPVLKTFYDKKSNRLLLTQAVTPTSLHILIVLISATLHIRLYLYRTSTS